MEDTEKKQLREFKDFLEILKEKLEDIKEPLDELLEETKEGIKHIERSNN